MESRRGAQVSSIASDMLPGDDYNRKRVALTLSMKPEDVDNVQLSESLNALAAALDVNPSSIAIQGIYRAAEQHE